MDFPSHLSPDKAVAFDPVEFQFAFAYATEVSHAPATMLNRPTDTKFTLKKGRKTEQYTFTDVPMNRLAISMVQRFQNDDQKYFSFMWRWFAFLDLMQSDILGDEFRQKAKKGGEPDMIHSAVIELVGSFPLTAKGRFEHAAFLAELRKRISQDDSAP